MMAYEQKLERMRKWTAAYPFIKPYVCEARETLEHTRDVDALCSSLVYDWCEVSFFSSVWKKQAWMLPCGINMRSKSDYAVTAKDGEVLIVDSKHPSKLSDGKTWFEIGKNKKSKASWLAYIWRHGDDAKVWFIRREGTLKDLEGLPQCDGRSGEKLWWFSLDDISLGNKLEFTMKGVFNGLPERLEEKLYA